MDAKLEQEFRRQMCDFGRRMHAQGFVIASEGNLSCRLGEGRYLCTPSGMSKGFMAADDLIVVDDEGRKVAGRREPTSEIRLHLRAYRERPEVQAVIHAHSPNAMAFAIAGVSPPPFILPEAEVLLGPIALAEYDTPGSRGVADNTAPHLRAGANAILLANHGAVALGGSLEEAFFRLETLEAYCRNLLLAGQIGRVRRLPPEKLPDLLAAKAAMGLDDPRRGREAEEYALSARNEFLRKLELPEAGSRPPLRGRPAEVIVAGHICLDVIPTLEGRQANLQSLLTPGKLVDVGAAVMSTGGAVSNTGLALHRLGVLTALMGKIGNDLFGRAVLDIVNRVDPALSKGMIVAEGESTSYTVVINPPGVDRVFLHCPGANDTFGAGDVDDARLAGARLFHFGYPPLMRRMYADGGGALAALLERAKKAGLTVSLDMARPDPDSPAGKVDWANLLRQALGHVDLFCPSLDEILFVLDRPKFERMQAAARGEGDAFRVDGKLLAEVAGRLLAMGPAVVLLKLGDQGAYLRTADAAARLAASGPGGPKDPAAWTGRELFAPCFQVNVVGATGAGDCAIAGFLAAVLRGDGPEAALTAAVAVGACNVEKADALSGIPNWSVVEKRLAVGWPQRKTGISLTGWHKADPSGVRRGPGDRSTEI